MRFFYNNLIDVSGVTITGSTTTSGYPATNVAHEFKTKVWRTGSTVAAETLTFDLGSAKAVTAVILLAHTLTASDTSIQLLANSSDSWGSPAFTQALTHASNVISQTFSSQTYRYWRITFTKSAAGETRDIGRVFLGTYHETAIQPDYDGFDLDPQDRTTKQKSIGGQTYADQRSQYRMLSLDWSGVSQSQMTNFKTIADTVGAHTSFFVQVDPNATAGTEPKEVLYVKFAKMFGRKVEGMDSDLVWETKMELEEQL